MDPVQVTVAKECLFFLRTIGNESHNFKWGHFKVKVVLHFDSILRRLDKRGQEEARRYYIEGCCNYPCKK